MRIAATRAIFLLSICASSMSYAQTINTHLFRFGDTLEMPTLEDGLGKNSELVQGNHRILLKASYDLANDLVTGTTPSRTSTFPFIEDMQTLSMGGGFLIYPRLLVGMDIPIHYIRLAGGYVTTQDPNAIRLGDIGIHAKIRLSRDSAKINVAFRPDMSLPTGNDAYFISDNSYGFGGKFLADTQIGTWKLFANAGFLYANNASFSSIDRKSSFEYGFGATRPLTDRLHLTGEWVQSIAMSDLNKSQTPTLINVGTRYAFQHVHFFAGGGIHRLKFSGNRQPFSLYAGIKTPLSFEIQKDRHPATSSETLIQPNKKSPEVISHLEAISSSVILFKKNSSAIQSESKQLLDEIALKISDVQDHLQYVVLYGYCDPRGDDHYNQILSEKRAKIVKSYLVKKGVNEQFILTEGKGEIPSDKPSEYSKLRKVEFKIIESGESTK